MDEELRHIVRAQQFSRKLMENIFREAIGMKSIAENRQRCVVLWGKKMVTLFYEPSTRTRASFEIAMSNLGGRVIFSTENAREFSSAAKGETLEDTIRILNGYFPDVIVLRHHESGAAERAAEVSEVPIINAGDGAGQHPTQALLDVFTIQKEIGKVDGIKIAMVGDLANGRTVRSLCYLLSKFKDVKIYFVAPDVVPIGADIKDHLKENRIEFEESQDLEKVAKDVDVIYQTRIQKERFGDRIADYEKARGKYVIDDRIISLMRPKAVVMHPLPRVDEIARSVDSDRRAAYFRQAQNGLFVRMALLKMILAEE